LKLKLNTIYKARYHVYDITDIGVYLLEIISESNLLYPRAGVYYEAKLVGAGHVVHFYPDDWSEIEEISSLEKELL
jgi:hypothetical protein